ncbi:MAG: histidine phosphatase family protein [Acidimicrobiales bacterium]|nr:histidine phosphatase family protein [Acidimicrobiales bacterium]
MLYVVRHGRTEANAAGLLLGRLDPDLDHTGWAQARAAANALGPVDRVVSSPLLRARNTAGTFSLLDGKAVEIDERWIEMDYGTFDGQPVANVSRKTWDVWRADLDWAPPEGESHRTLGIRVRAALEELHEESRTSEIVVVTHVSPIKAALAWALGVGDEVAWRAYVAPASVMTIGAGPEGPSLRGFNDTGHL